MFHTCLRIVEQLNLTTSYLRPTDYVGCDNNLPGNVNIVRNVQRVDRPCCKS